MQRRADIPYIEVGEGPPLVCVHGSLCDFRIWSPVLGVLAQGARVIAPSLPHFFPGRWSGKAGDFTIARHVEAVIAFIESFSEPVHLLGHSRGGHIAFRLAGARPDLLRSLVLAEPGGDLGPTLAPPGEPPTSLRAHVAAAVQRIADGDTDGGLEIFVDAIDGAGVWRKLPAASQQQLRDNATTLLGQIDEQRHPYERADAEAIRVPTLFIGGADTPGSSPHVLRALAAHVPDARTVIIPLATHLMFAQAPVQFGAAVREFIAAY